MTEKDSYVPLKIQALVKTALTFTRSINWFFFNFIEGKDKERANFTFNYTDNKCTWCIGGTLTHIWN